MYAAQWGDRDSLEFASFADREKPETVDLGFFLGLGLGGWYVIRVELD